MLWLKHPHLDNSGFFERHHSWLPRAGREISDSVEQLQQTWLQRGTRPSSSVKCLWRGEKDTDGGPAGYRFVMRRKWENYKKHEIFFKEELPGAI